VGQVGNLRADCQSALPGDARPLPVRLALQLLAN
jgi:hypothetical protein